MPPGLINVPPKQVQNYFTLYTPHHQSGFGQAPLKC